MKQITREELSESLKQDLLQVEAALGQSYCPHSGLCVAAGLVLRSGGIVTGVNYECASYGLTQCAERNAIGRAQVEGKIDEIDILLLSTCYKETDEVADALTPCGACRQWLLELSNRLGRDIEVYSFWKGSNQGLKGSVRDLLPKAFS